MYGTWPVEDIKKLEYGSRKGGKKTSNDNLSQNPPVTSTPKNNANKKGKLSSLSSSQYSQSDAPRSPIAKRKLKEITVSEFLSHPSKASFSVLGILSVRVLRSNVHQQGEQAPSHLRFTPRPAFRSGRERKTKTGSGQEVPQGVLHK